MNLNPLQKLFLTRFDEYYLALKYRAAPTLYLANSLSKQGTISKKINFYFDTATL